MKVILSAFGGKLRGEINIPKEYNEIRMPLMERNVSQFDPPEDPSVPIMKVGVFRWLGKTEWGGFKVFELVGLD